MAIGRNDSHWSSSLSSDSWCNISLETWLIHFLIPLRCFRRTSWGQKLVFTFFLCGCEPGAQTNPRGNEPRALSSTVKSDKHFDTAHREYFTCAVHLANHWPTLRCQTGGKLMRVCWSSTPSRQPNSVSNWQAYRNTFNQRTNTHNIEREEKEKSRQPGWFRLQRMPRNKHSVSSLCFSLLGLVSSKTTAETPDLLATVLLFLDLFSRSFTLLG